MVALISHRFWPILASCLAGVNTTIEKHLLDYPRIINHAEDPHRILADGTAQRVNMPHPQNEVPPALGGESQRRRRGNAWTADNELRRQPPLPHAAHLVAIPINQRERLRLQYQRLDGATGEYLLEPYHLVAYDGNWYLLALSTAAGHMETFALSRCRFLAGTDES